MVEVVASWLWWRRWRRQLHVVLVRPLALVVVVVVVVVVMVPLVGRETTLPYRAVRPSPGGKEGWGLRQAAPGAAGSG